MVPLPDGNGKDAQARKETDAVNNYCQAFFADRLLPIGVTATLDATSIVYRGLPVQ